MKLMIAVLLTACCVPAAVQAQDDAAPAKTKKAANPNRKTCRTGQSTGSHFTSSICHTADEWAQIDAANERTQENGRSTGGAQR